MAKLNPFFLSSIEGGELFERIVDDNFEHTELTSARYMRQILEGMQYMHKQKIIHLDLKPENIVCVDTNGTQIKIIDFGLAAELGEVHSMDQLKYQREGLNFSKITLLNYFRPFLARNLCFYDIVSTERQ